ncbi:unnamed protein product [Kuraishia capsulata CBS 1993]|uniref:Alkaline ceramidase n=1 Tax=Kuraishia capsulata CBS 1993 TaxID=1382522 RepID=W6MG40_9ASCO|nr:uncharacterized protein KUCA_T00000370001 [Kuraishia capsulata CBS 1993]CDK24408.1 unnamed protein product [Kuraishia capsulata CBS 1993]
MGFLSIDYGTPYHGEEGYWGPVTATIDWCEENYVISRYFAEFVNSITNLSFFFLAGYHLYSAVKNKHGVLYIFIAIGMAFVGFGSWLFHMTLRYEFQLMDELPMIYVTAIPFGYLFGHNKPPRTKLLVHLATGFFTVLLTVVYVFIYKNPALHQASYAALNFSIIWKTLNNIQLKVKDRAAQIFLYKMLGTAFSMFIFGFLIWNLDNVFCQYLIHVRRNYLGLPYGIFIEGHGWWHIFTSLGIYYFVTYNEVLSTWMDDKQEDYKVVWHGPICEVVLKDKKDVARKEQ